MVVSPWLRPDAFPPPPARAEQSHGWWDGQNPRETTREELEERCRKAKGVLLVWTPESSGTVADHEVAFLRAALLEREAAAVESNFRWSWFCFILWTGLLALGFDEGRRPAMGMVMWWFALGLLPLAVNGWRRRALRRKKSTVVSASPEERENARFTCWLARRRTSLTTTIAVVLGLVFLVQLVVGANRATLAAGLAKDAFWAGEWWRAATGPWLHANVPHLVFNLSAFVAFGRVVEAVLGGRRLLQVLALALLAGSAASVCWLEATSVGFSGAILGLLGFQLGLAQARPASLPPGTRKQGLFGLALVAGVGLVGWDVIDNAAHFGGVAAGVLAGWMAGRR